MVEPKLGHFCWSSISKSFVYFLIKNDTSSPNISLVDPPLVTPSRVGQLLFLLWAPHPTDPHRKYQLSSTENSTQKYWASVGQPSKPLVLLFFIIENLNWTFYWSTKMFILNKENYVGNQNTRHQLRKCWKITKIVAVS